jgi:hypothetical protein
MTKAADLANLIGNIKAGGGGVNRNILINSAMNVAQRGSSSTGIGASSGYFTCDRWLFGREAGTEEARFTMTQDTASVGIDSLPFQEAGIRTALKMDVTTAESAVAAGEASYIIQRIEGVNCSNYDIKTKPITLSFYAKSDTKTGTMCASLYASSGARHHVKEYSITTDWQRFSLTFPADSGATALANDNSNELQLNFALSAGSNLQVTADQWASGFDIATSNQINFADSTDNNWYLTGVQLEVGQNPTEFEREPFDTTLVKCQRYYQLVGKDFSDTTPTTAFTHGFTSSGSAAEGMFRFERRMRTAPTFTASTDGNIDFRTNSGSGAVHLSGNAFTSATTSETSVFYSQENHAGNFGGAGQPYYLRFNGLQSSALTASNQLDAEL